MKPLTLTSLFVPPEALLPLLTLAGLLMIIGLRKPARALIAFVLLVAFLPLLTPVFDALFDALPAWAGMLVLAAMALMVLNAIGVGRFLRDVLAHALGELLARLLGFIFALPFRALRALIGLVFRR